MQTNDQGKTIHKEEEELMEAVAIIGMGCRFPGAPNPHAFWQLMCNGGDAITEVPADRYDVDAVYDPRPATPGKVMSRYGGFLEQVDQFDAAFFGISPREAARMDPQHRLLLEVAWEAMEDAGVVPAMLTEAEKLNIACFIGVITGDYWDRQFRNAAHLDVYATCGSARSGAAGRISFSQDLMGTSFAIDAACSSSLVAVDQAVQNLRSGACTMAVAGGVNVILNPDHTIGFSQGKMMAADGHCKTYDASADGYVRSEGAGIVVLKLLSQALADNDQIYALIRGSASNNDGRSDSFMAPSTRGQQAGLRKACQNAGITPLSITYVEAHGPGTKAGDPIEITTLGEVLCAGRTSDQPLLVGSVKTNIGHTEGAAGVAGLIKTALCLSNGMIPPNLHFHTPSPLIPWENYAIKIPTKLTPWPPSDAGPRRAAVCSYGIAGTNTYILVEEAPGCRKNAAKAEPGELPSLSLLPMSAQTAEALTELVHRYLTHLEDEAYADQTLRTIAATAGCRRAHHEYRLALVSHSRQDTHEKLTAFLGGERGGDVIIGRRLPHARPKLAWIFPGQGSQWLGMGRDLLEQEPVFRATLEACDRAMSAYADWSLLDQLRADEAHTRLHEIDVVQPTLFAIEVALAALWRSWGIEPDVVVGHSMGEIAAAYVAGALSLEDAAWIICARSKLLLRVSGKGAMAAVDLSLEQARIVASDYNERISVAVSNSPHSTVLSGDSSALKEILALLESQGIFGQMVKVDIASHSSQMDSLRDDLLRLTQGVRSRATTVPLFSTLKGAIVSGEELTNDYWFSNLREPVLFCASVQALLEDGCTLFLEMSPHPILVGAMRQTIAAANRPGKALPSLRRQEEGRAVLLATLGNLYVQGCDPDWPKLYPEKKPNISLPTYPWQRQRYWNAELEKPGSLAGLSFSTRYSAPGSHPLLSSRTPSALRPEISIWTTSIDTEQFPYLQEHCVHGMPVLACAAYLELALAAASEVCAFQEVSVEDLTLKKALFLPKGSTHLLQVVLAPEEDGKLSLRFFSSMMEGTKPATLWTEHASAIVQCQAKKPEPEIFPCLSPEQAPDEWMLTLEAPAYYAGLRARGIQHGPRFQGITHIWQRTGEVMARITIPEKVAVDMPGYLIHPALMDACLQGITPFLPADQPDETYVPVAVRQVRLHQKPEAGDALWTYAVLHPTLPAVRGMLEGNVFLLNEQGQVLLEVTGLRLQALDNGNTQEFTRQRLNQLLYTMQWQRQDRRKQPKSQPKRVNWLIFSADHGLGEALAERVKAAGAHCVTIMPGVAYRQLARERYELPLADQQAFSRLFYEVYGENEEQFCHGIIYLWGTLAASVDDNMTKLAPGTAEIGVLHLLQTMTTMRRTTLPRIWLVTSDVHAIEEQEPTVALLQAPLWGLGRVMAYEHPDLHTTLIDIDHDSLAGPAEALFQEIWSNDGEDEVALRGERRYVARITHAHLPDEQEQCLFHVDGTYVITGGLGGIGLRTAQWMIEQGARHLVLMGRSKISETGAAAIEALRAAGARIQSMQVDVSQAQQLECALHTVRSAFPPVRGIFHAAVVLDDSTLLQLNSERFLRVRAPKVDGAWNLHRLTLDDPLDYFVLFSSAASLIGSPGQGNYAAANAFLDQLAFYRQQRGYPALCVNWGRWGEVGQAMQEQRGQRLDARGFASIKPAEGLAILGNLLKHSLPQMGVMALHLPSWSQFYPNLMNSSLFTDLIVDITVQEEQKASSQRLTREMLIDLNDEQRQLILVQYLNDQIARVLGHTTLKLDPHQLMNRLGIDSLLSVELKNRIGSDLQVTIPATVFLQTIPFEQFVTQIRQQL